MATRFPRSRAGTPGVEHLPTSPVLVCTRSSLTEVLPLKEPCKKRKNINPNLQLLNPESTSALEPFLPGRNLDFSKHNHFDDLNCLHREYADILLCARPAFMKILTVFLNIFSHQYSFNHTVFVFFSKNVFPWWFLESLVVSDLRIHNVISRSDFLHNRTQTIVFRNFFVKSNISARVRGFLPDLWQIGKAFLWSALSHWIMADKKKNHQKVITSSCVLILMHSLYSISHILLEFFTLYFPVCLIDLNVNQSAKVSMN